MRILRAALASGLLLASAGGARASGTQSVQCTGNPAADGAALVKAFHDINLANGGVIVLAEKCVYGLTSPAPVEDLGFWFGPTGLPVVTSTIVVEGNGSTIKPVGPTSGGVRLIAVAGPAGQIPGASPAYPHTGNLTLRNLTLSGGKAQGGHGASSAVRSGGGGAGLGGAAFVQGTLTLDAVTIRECTAHGGNGGVTFLAADPTGNGGGGGLGGDGGDGGGGFAGAGAIAGGGAVTDAAGATPGDWGTAPSPWGLGTPANGRGGDATEPNGGFGGGGAFVSGALGGAGGVGGGGGGCADTGACTGGNGGFGGGGGAGNAIDGALGGVSLFGGGNGAPNSGAPGFGGGLAGTSANGAPAAGGGGAGLGGAIFVHGGALTVRNSTFVGNSAQGGVGGTLRPNGFQIQGSDGGAGYGGAIFVLNGTVSIASSTFDNNIVNGGLGGDGAVPGARGPSVGSIYAAHLDLGGVPAGPTMVTIANTIVARTFDVPPPSDCGLAGGAMLVSGGTNLVKVPGECVFAGAGDLIGVAPTLSPIADNGGPVQTIAVADQAATAGACTDLVDARGVPRVAPCAIGAYQPGGYPLTVITEGAGTVTSSPAGIDCGATCTATIDPLAVPQTYTFTASPGAGARFAGWGGACGGSFPTCTVTVRGATTVRALFFVPSPDAGVGAGGDAGLPPIGGGSNGCCDVRGSDNRASLVLLLAVAFGLRRRRR